MLKFFFWVIASLHILLFGFAFVALATSEADITFPVAELGNCTNKQECKTYCNAPEHIQACVAFAKQHNLLNKKEIERGEKFAKVAAKAGPGGCRGHEACQTYCENIDHIEECVAFGEANGLIPAEELQEAKKVAQAIKRGAKRPAGCSSKQACEAYCSQEGHFEECITFAREAGFVSEEEYQMAKKTQGKGPGDCRGKEQCEAYCHDESHFQECVEFGRKHGFVSEKEAEIALKTGGKGPGGCRQDECKTYCENPAHQEECIRFAKEHGLISEEELKHMEEGKRKFQEALSQAPPEVQACIREVAGPDLQERIQNGAIQPGPEIGERIRECFERERHPGLRGGPGGCATPEECKAYCSSAEHSEQCKQFFQEKMPENRPPFDTRSGQEQEGERDVRMDINRLNMEGDHPPFDMDKQDPGRQNRICAQVITPARDPQSGMCKVFPTPCDVPQGWARVEKCEGMDVSQPRIFEQKTPAANIQSPGGCKSKEECDAYCKEHPAACGPRPQDNGQFSPEHSRGFPSGLNSDLNSGGQDFRIQGRNFENGPVTRPLEGRFENNQGVFPHPPEGGLQNGNTFPPPLPPSSAAGELFRSLGAMALSVLLSLAGR